MYIIYVLNHRARPETVTLKIEAKYQSQVDRAAVALIQSGLFPEDTYTIVHGCLSEPLERVRQEVVGE